MKYYFYQGTLKLYHIASDNSMGHFRKDALYVFSSLIHPKREGDGNPFSSPTRGQCPRFPMILSFGKRPHVLHHIGLSDSRGHTKKDEEAVLLRGRLLRLYLIVSDYTRRRRRARPARPTSISRPEVGSGTLTDVHAPAACDGVDWLPNLIC